MHAGFWIEVVDDDEFVVVVDDPGRRKRFWIDCVCGKAVAAVEDCFWVGRSAASPEGLCLMSSVTVYQRSEEVVKLLHVRLDLQAFGLAERGKRSVDGFPGTAVLETCSSKSSAVALFGLGIFRIKGWPLGVRSL